MSEPRCLRCRDPLILCSCAAVTPLELGTHVAVVLHTREAQKRAATGPFALTALSNSSLHLYGKRDSPLDLTGLHRSDRRVFLLHPSEDAVRLTRELVLSSDLPVTLVIPDGSLRQASRAARRIPGLASATRVRLPHPEPRAFLALSRALGILESAAVEEQLLQLFAERQQRGPGRHSDAELATSDVSALEEPHRRAANELEILHQDEHVVAVNKPSGMLVHRGWGKEGAVLLQVLRDQLGEHVFPVHRLDRATSGALIFARTSEVARELKALFDAEEVKKRYLALCRGNSVRSVTIEHALAPESGKQPVRAVTEVRLLGAFERYGLVEARPLTGRTHQIRKHLKHISHPIIGDVRYGKGEHNRLFRERFGFHRLALHCESLTLLHPRTRATLSIHAPLPADFSTLLAELGLAQSGLGELGDPTPNPRTL